MSMDKATVRRIATLARIRVGEDDLDRLAGELGHILHWVEQLDEVDTGNVLPMASIGGTELPHRADRVTDGDYPDRILANAPVAENGFFAVPKVVE